MLYSYYFQYKYDTCVFINYYLFTETRCLNNRRYAKSIIVHNYIMLLAKCFFSIAFLFFYFFLLDILNLSSHSSKFLTKEHVVL